MINSLNKVLNDIAKEQKAKLEAQKQKNEALQQ